MNNMDAKIFLANNIINARRYILKLNIKGDTLLNYEVYTPTMLINTLLKRINPNLRLISNKEASYIIYKLIKDDARDYSLDKSIFTIGASKKLMEVINDYRLSLINEYKYIYPGNYKKLMDDYKNYLDKNNLTDYIYALDLISNIKIDKKVYIIDDFDISIKEEKVFNNIFLNISKLEIIHENYKISGFYSCYGIYNEILNIFNIIDKNKYPINDCEIIYTSDIYENLLRGALDSKNIDYSIGSAHAKSTNLISFMLDILEYINSDYKYELLEEILLNKGLDEIYLKEYYKTLEFPKYSVGFGLDRTKIYLREIKDDESKINIYLFLSDLVGCGTKDNFDYRKLLELTFKYITNSNEKMALSNKLNNLTYIIDIAEDKINTAKDELSSLRYSESYENSLQISLINKSFSLKKYLFIIGLSQNYIISADTENPFIIDVEKYKNYLGCGKYLHILDNLKDNIVDSINYYLNNSMSENIYLSYPNFNKIDLRPQAPSIFYLNLLKDNTEEYVNLYDIKLDNIKFSEIKVEKVEEDPDSHDNGKIKPLVDGKAHLDLEDQKPIIITKEKLDNTFKLSPSAIKKLQACPFDYYYNYLKRLPSPSFLSLNEYEWLEFNTKGTFFHEILELYAKEALGINNFKDKFDEVIFDRVFNVAKTHAESLNPIKNEYIYHKELDEIKEMAKNYIHDVIKDLIKTNYRVLGCEFELKNTKCVYEYKDKLITFTGSIDRVDGYIDGRTLHLRVVDYKTGKFHKKQDNTHIQHIIYPYCLINSKVKLFDLDYDDVIVDKFIYDYPYEKEILVYENSEIVESDEKNKVFDNINNLIIPYLNDEDYYSKMEEYFDNNTEISDSSFDKRVCEYCKFSNLCYKKLKEGKEWVPTKKN